MALQQVHLVKSGVQFWSSQVIATTHGRFAYASTLAIYVFDAGSFRLERVVTGMEKSVACIALSQPDSDGTVLLAVGTIGNTIDVFALYPQCTPSHLVKHSSVGFAPEILKFSQTPKGGNLVVAGAKCLSACNASTGTLTTLKSFDAQIKSVSCNSCRAGSLAAAVHSTVHFFDPNGKHTKLQLDTEVLAVKFDPLSETYMLIAFKDGRINLFDTDSKEQLHSFAKQPGLSHICWIPGAPGSFITAASKSTVLRVWNVSQFGSISQLRTGADAGSNAVTSCCAFDNSTDVLVTFKNGAIGAYDTHSERCKWHFSGGHTETSFDCAICPTNANVLASTGYDATVKLWDIENLNMLGDIAGPKTPLFSLTWSLDGSLLAVAGNEGKVGVIDANAEVVKVTAQHHSDSVMKVQQHPGDRNMLVTSSRDGNACIMNWNLELTGTFKHQHRLFGSSWNPFRWKTFATCSETGLVYVWNLDDASKPSQTLVEKSKAFSVAWSQHAPQLMCVTYDDRKARVWNIDTEKFRELKGHSNKVRGCVWHTELPYIVITGSWDCTIRTWDVRTGACLHVAFAHKGDVYSFSIHAQRPFRLASCSRDTTLRIWSIQSFGQVSAAAAHSGKLMVQTSLKYTLDGYPDVDLLCGAGSNRLQETWARGASQIHRQEEAALFFSATPGIQRLFQLVRMCYERDGTSDVDVSHRTFALHLNQNTEILGARAAELESYKSKRVMGPGTVRKEAVMRSAARLHLELGNIDAYCQLMKALGHWEQAVAVAPAIGIEYWSRLIYEWAKDNEEKGKDSSTTLPLRLAIGDADGTIRTLESEKAFDDAFTVAVSQYEGTFDGLALQTLNQRNQHRATSSSSGGKGRLAPLQNMPSGGNEQQKKRNTEKVRSVRRKQANMYMQECSPVLAACCHLSANDHYGAVSKLILGWELTAAASVASLTCGEEGQQLALHIRVSLLEQSGLIELALDETSTMKDWWRSQILCVRHNAGEAEQSNLKRRALALPEGESNKQWVTALHALQRNDMPRSIAICNEQLSSALECSTWDWDDIIIFLSMLCCISPEGIDVDTLNKSFALLSYFGAILAAWTNWDAAVEPLIEVVRKCVEPNRDELPTALQQVAEAYDDYDESQRRKTTAEALRAKVTDAQPPMRINALSANQILSDLDWDADQSTPHSYPRIAGSNLPGSSTGEHLEFISKASSRQGPERILDARLSRMNEAEVAFWVLTMPIAPFHYYA